MITEDGSVFVDGLVQSCDRGFIIIGSGGFDQEEIGLGGVIRIVKEF